MPSASTFRSTTGSGRGASAGRLAAIVVAAGLLPSVSHPGQQYRARTELVALQVSVVDGGRRYVADLTAEDFAVLEEGVPAAVSVFAAASTPLDVMLLLDSSASMEGRMPIAQAAAISFLHTLRPEDRGAVILFDTRILAVHPFTGDVPALEAVVRQAAPGGGTSLNQAVYVALRELALARRREPQLRRQALVVLTDGEDNAENLTFDVVREEARRSAVTIFAVVPGVPTRRPTSDRFLPPPRLVPFDMRTLADETGGRVFAPDRLEDLTGSYADIAHELSQQYCLGFVPAPSAGGFRRVSVRVTTRPGLSARTRTGYIADSPRRPRTAFAAAGPR
jgi:VWFA-related protein